EYYVLDNPTVSDGEYDKLYDKLVELEKQTGIVLFDSPTKRVGGEPISSFKKHNHINRLYSLDKSLDYSELENFDKKVKKVGDTNYTVEYKFDGLTICLTYDKGKFVRATTRGNGSVGEDVTAQVLTIKTFPLSIKYQGLLEVKGEAIIRLSVLEEYNKTAKEQLKNARNAVAGAIRNLDPKITEERKCEINFYDINYIQDNNLINSQQQAINFLKEQGFKVFNYLKVCSSIQDVISSIKEIDSLRRSLDVLTDGAVVKVDDYKIRDILGETDKFPRWAMAFKFEAEEVTTNLQKVFWQVGRTGKLTPLGEVEPVELAGATVKKATLNNYNDIIKKGIKEPCRVLIRRSNEVIPEILGATEYYKDSKQVLKPTACPCCNSSLIEKGANLFCINENCKQRVISNLANFAQKDAMNIDGFSEMTASQLYDELGVKTFSDIYSLTKEQLVSLDRFGEKKAENLTNAIIASKKVNLANFIFALGIDNVGKKMAKELAKKYKTLNNIMLLSKEELTLMEEVGEVTAEYIYEFFNNKKNKIEIENLINLGVEIIEQTQEVAGILTGHKIVVTGTLENYKRKEIQDLIESLGAEAQSTVTKTTTLVIVGADAGSKKQKAEKLGIKIISEQEFMQMINS
ncbi:MAG: NAD-dependent DNA ligase LigA, partial [Clostridia bacterium]|nr:NAD-dependent DNA ligase LigA [Clostridia bacterium]